MLLHVLHRTHYVYPHRVSETHHEARLQPLTDDSQTCSRFQITVEPPANIRSYQEPGGTVHFFNVRDPHAVLSVTVETDVETLAVDEVGAVWEGDDWPFYLAEDVRQDFAEYLVPTKLVPFVAEAMDTANAIR